MKYLLKLSYLGTNYRGFQVQPRGKTVQGILCDVGSRIFSCDCLVTGCSRTDSGVHAIEYYATLETCDTSPCIPEEKLPRAMNTYLPCDISVQTARIVPDDFSVRKNVLGKEYMYLIHNAEAPNPFLADRALEYPHALDVGKMNAAAKYFLGRHDFAAFMASGSDVADTVRTVSDLRVEREGELIRIFVSADGFLYNMVRIIVGTLIEVSEGKIPEEKIPEIIESESRDRAGRTAQAKGLYLSRVFLK